MKLSFKLALVIFLLMCIISSFVLIFVYDKVVSMRVDEMRQSLLMTARVAASFVDGDAHNRIPVNPAGVGNAYYLSVQQRLKQVKAQNPFIKYIYTLAKNARGELCFIVDAASTDEIFSRPGDRYDTTKLGKQFDQFLEAEVKQEMLTDQWGTFISGYAPIFNKRGERVALLGVDMLMNVVDDAKRVIRQWFVYMFVISILVSFVLGALIARLIAGPVKLLVQGTRRIGGGDLNYQVPVRSQDEIGELARSFNEMACSLKKSYDDLQMSFMSTIRTLMIALEAKDAYTKGHSERVAEYCGMIAEEMNVSASDVRALKDLALMHDIGKIGIKEDILNKPDRLTEPERRIIEQHATIGEDILKPLASYYPTLLSLIRSHHERPDGTGYPDGLSGEEIPLLVSILTVADAYDAMVTDRPYRAAMPKEDALRELQAQAGKKYNGTIVAALERALAKRPA